MDIVTEPANDETAAWCDQSERLMRTYVLEYAADMKKHERNAKIFKWLHVSLLFPTILLSYIFGSSGIATDDKTIKNAQNYVLLGVGCATTIMNLGKFEKRSHLHKKKKSEYQSFVKKIEYELSLPRQMRKPYSQFARKVEAQRKELTKRE